MYTLHYIYKLHNIFVGHLGAVKALKSAHIANIDEHVNMCKAQSVRQRPPKIWVYSNHFCVFNENLNEKVHVISMKSGSDLV